MLIVDLEILVFGSFLSNADLLMRICEWTVDVYTFYLFVRHLYRFNQGLIVDTITPQLLQYTKHMRAMSVVSDSRRLAAPSRAEISDSIGGKT